MISKVGKQKSSNHAAYSSSFLHFLHKDLKNSLGDAGVPAVSECFCSIQYTVYCTSYICLSFLHLINQDIRCQNPTSSAWKLVDFFEVCISKTTALKPNLWRRGWKKTGGFFVLGIFSWRETTACLFFLGGGTKNLGGGQKNRRVEKMPPPSPQKSVGIDVWYNGNRSHLKLQGIVLSWLCLYVFYPSGFKITFSTNGFFL